jgi:hypothetical protein
MVLSNPVYFSVFIWLLRYQVNTALACQFVRCQRPCQIRDFSTQHRWPKEMGDAGARSSS